MWTTLESQFVNLLILKIKYIKIFIIILGLISEY